MLKKVLLLVFLLVLTVAIFNVTISRVNAQVQPYAAIYPSEGNVYTDIYIQVRGLDNVRWSLYLFWDDTLLIEGLENPGGSDGMTRWWYGYYDIHIHAPNEHPLSDLGNHTIFVQTWRSATESFNFTLTFEIIEQLPCDEWLSLNATYYDLLADYEALNASYHALEANYSSLLADYSSLYADYDNLLSDYNSLLNDYGSLSDSYATMVEQYNSLSTSYSSLQNTHSQLQSSYNSLSASYNALTQSYDYLQSNYSSVSNSFSQLQSNYNSLSNSYNSLQGNCSSLQTNYNSLKTNYDLLKSIHDSLKANYDSLESNNSNLTTSYDTLVGELSFVRNLSYLFTATTMILIATTIYLVFRKPKVKTT